MEETSATRVLPVAVKTIQSIKPELQEGYRAFSGNRLADAKGVFLSVLQSLLLVPITSDAEAADVRLLHSLLVRVDSNFMTSGETS